MNHVIEKNKTALFHKDSLRGSCGHSACYSSPCCVPFILSDEGAARLSSTDIFPSYQTFFVLAIVKIDFPKLIFSALFQEIAADQ